MFVRNINNIFIFLLLIIAGVNGYKKSDAMKKDTTIYSIADVLQSLLKLNEARYETFKKLNDLNSIHYLRSVSEKENGNLLWKLFHKLASVLKLTFKPNHEETTQPKICFYDVYHDGKYIFTIPVPENINLNVQFNITEENDQKNDINKDYDKNDLRHSCRRGKTRCKAACSEALRMTCIILPICEYSFFIQMLISCKEECEDRFY